MIFVGEREKCHFVKFAFLSKRNADFSVLGRSMLGPSWSQGGSCCAKFAPSWHQVGPSPPKLAQVGPKLIPSWPQVGPCWFKLVPRWLQVGPKLAQVGPSWPKLGPSWSQYGPKLSHVGSCCPLPPSPQKEFLRLCFPRCPRRLCLYEGAANVQVTSRCSSMLRTFK